MPIKTKDDQEFKIGDLVRFRELKTNPFDIGFYEKYEGLLGIVSGFREIMEGDLDETPTCLVCVYWLGSGFQGHRSHWFRDLRMVNRAGWLGAKND